MNVMDPSHTNTPKLKSKFDTALQYASDVHRRQIREGSHVPYVAHLLGVTARSILADYRHVGDKVWKRFTGRKQGTLWYYRELVKAFREVGPHLMAEELGRVVTQLERLAARRPAQRRSPPRRPAGQDQ